ncbi:hypothetical protein ABGT15_10730 [Flavobacterium enshiense]|uniref:hypothetical protein n=1 Tax=Flavobacterium enshiense TaxID=1341165 RepID=UPI00345CCBE6
MKQLSFFIFFFLCITELVAQENIITEIQADVDNDKRNEKIVVTELEEQGEYGKIRQLDIYKWQNKKWQKMVTSRTAVLGSEGGGMMGDPFFDKNLSVKNSIITIEHNGGSSWKWGTTHKYRYQNNRFELIGYSTIFGKPCEYWGEFDYNLSNGKIHYKKEYETCEEDYGDPVISKTEDETFRKKLKKLPTLENINTYEIKITSPKFKEELNF